VARELILVVLLVCVPLGTFARLLGPPEGGRRDARVAERRRWIEIWLPLVPALVAGACFVGWLILETKAVHPVVAAVAVLFGLVWVRALVRAVAALLGRTPELPAVTRGLVWPRVEVSRALLGALDEEAAHAVYLHEDAHRRHRDPLRIWLAQLATDLEFPLPWAPRRLERWLVALEIARDEEARRSGVDGAALAEAIITAARLSEGPAKGVPHAAIADPGGALEERIGRLLEPLEREDAGLTRAAQKKDGVAEAEAEAETELDTGIAALLGAMLLAAALVLSWGDEIVRALPGVMH
jgi:hypothetical protein